MIIKDPETQVNTAVFALFPPPHLSPFSLHIICDGGRRRRAPERECISLSILSTMCAPHIGKSSLAGTWPQEASLEKGCERGSKSRISLCSNPFGEMLQSHILLIDKASECVCVKGFYTCSWLWLLCIYIISRATHYARWGISWSFCKLRLQCKRWFQLIVQLFANLTQFHFF